MCPRRSHRYLIYSPPVHGQTEVSQRPRFLRAPDTHLSYNCRTGLSRAVCAERLLDQVVVLSRERIYGRLESVHWQPPGYLHHRRLSRTPLHTQLRKLAETAIQPHPNSPVAPDQPVQPSELDKLRDLCELIESSDTNDNHHLLKTVAKQSYRLCTRTSPGRFLPDGRGLHTNELYSTKPMKQANKIGRYWGLCIFLAEVSRRYRSLFQNLRLELVPPSNSVHVRVSPGRTEGTKRVKCRVHAEIQLLVFYGLRLDPTILDPRIIGTSKSACYLCDLFITLHGQFFVDKTHGHLHEKWMFPDLAGTPPSQQRVYRKVLAAMDRALVDSLAVRQRQQGMHKRSHPMQSWITFTSGFKPSPLQSDMGTIIPEAAGSIRMPVRSAAVPASEESLGASPFSRREHAHIASPPSDSGASGVRLASPLPSSIDLWLSHPPVVRVISSHQPIRLHVGELDIQVEIAGHGGGKVALQRVEGSSAVGPKPLPLIDVGALAPNESVDLDASHPERLTDLVLRHGFDWIWMSLQWEGTGRNGSTLHAEN